MDSWTLQGDSYSFLRSAPRTFSLCHRDGTPNHVEIFDIINVPNQSSAISETTCLCDIFGDDCESPSLSSSPAVGRFIPPQREVEGTAAASPPVDDLNDSSGSYHTAHGSSEGEEGFDDSGERLSSPTLESEDSQRTKTGGTGHSEVSEDSNPNLEPKSKSPLQQLTAGSPSSETLNTGERTPPPRHKSPFNLIPARSPSSSSFSVEKRCSPSPHNPGQAHPEAESNRITPTFKDKKHSDQGLTSSTSSLPRNCASLSAEPSNTQSFTEVTAQASPEPSSSCFSQYRSPPSEDFSSDFSEQACKSRTPVSSPLSSFSGKESSPHSRGSSAQSYTPDTPASSPFQELTGRISLPDLFSRGSTPDREASTHSPSATGREITTTPVSQNRRSSTEPLSTVSTPAPQYTPPSPISRATYPELVESRASSEIRNTSPSSFLLSAASPTQTGTRSPSPAQLNRIRQFPTPGTQVSSPAISYSLSPSPEVTRDCSPTAPSPEIRITASSPDTNRREWLSEVKSASASPLREFSLASSRSPTSSPHITGISYSVVQPEDRDSPPFPELQRLSTPEPDRTLSGSAEAKSLTPGRDSLQSSTTEPSDTRQDSTHISGFSSPVLQPRYHTPSPRPKHLTPSPEVTYQTTSTEKYHSPSPQERSKDPSSVVESPEQRFYQPSPSNLCSDNKRPSPLLRNTPDVEENQSSGRIRDTVLPASLEKQSVSPSFTFKSGEKSENKSLSPVVTPVTISPEEKKDNSLRQSLERDATPKRAHLEESVSLDSFSEEPICPSLSQKEDPYNNLLIEIKSSPPDLIRSQGRSPNISSEHKASSITPLQGLGTPLPKPTSYSLNSPAFTPGRRRKLLPTIIRRESREIFTEDMAHHANRRRTPSPPLTRFTPVHIIAPEKPYRQWQSRSRSPSQFVASSNSGNLKKVVTNRENPNVALVDNNSQAHWVSQGTQLEMEKQMQLEEDREVVRERLKHREIEKERKREEQVPEKGKGWQGDATYRGEQAELSFNARNRKGPVSCRTAPTSREIRQALPTVHSYSESLLATRRLQQHSLLASQQDHRGVGSSRRQQPPALQNRNTTPRRVASNRPGRSSSSSMGSELDETDNEVKWFTDVAFSSLSSPEADYLDMYNSSHHSSTNISQSSTQESPAGVNAAWPAYADFRGSAQKLDNDDLSFQQPYPYYSDGLDPSRRYELGSFECVDVAMEREDHRKVRRGVPKRQIQLKRKNAAEVKQDESSENSSPGAPVMVESSSLESHSSEMFMRQQITPAAMEECYPSERSPEPNQQNKLQKSASLDESCAKTKMATCLIQSVLSKKIQSGDKQQNEQAGEEVSPSFEETAPQTETVASPFKESPKPTLSSSLQSDFSVSSEGLSVKGEPNIKDKVKMTKSFGVKSSNRPSSSSSSRSVNFSQTESEDTDSDTRNTTSLRFESKSEKKLPCDYKHPRTEAQKVDDKKTWDETEGGESANASEGNTGAPSVTRARTTNRDQECENTEDHKQLQQGDKSAHTSSTPEITVEAVEKKKASLNVCLTPEAEDKPEGPSPDLSFTEKEEREEAGVDDKIEEEEANGNSQVKVPIHKVRDVRRLVKNTYNLSFKATGAAVPSTVNEEQMPPFNQEITDKVEGQRIEMVKADEKRREDRKEEFMERKKEQKEDVKDSQPLQRKRNPLSRPQPMQIEYRAVCSKDGNNKISCSKSGSESLDDKSQASPKLPMKSSKESQMSSNANNLLSGETATISPSQHDLNTASVRPETVTVLDKVLDNEGKPLRMDRKPPMLGSLPRQSSKEREVSTAVVLIRDGSSKTKTTATQEEVSTKSQAPAASPSPGPATSGSAPGTSGHSVSMLLKEKGYQADIGAVVGDKENGVKGVPCKHVNSLEIPLQATAPADEGQIQSHRERTFSASSNKSTPSAVPENTDILTKTEDEGVSIKPTVKDPAKQKSPSTFRTMNEQTEPPTKPKELGDFEAVKRLDPTFPPRSPAIRRFRPQAIEVKSLSKDTQKQETPTNAPGNNVPQAIEVTSIAKNSQKPIVPPKPTCKFKPADLGMMPNEAQRPSAISTTKPQSEERSQTIVVSSPTIYRKISSDSTSTSHSARKLAVSAVSSIKPPPCKTAATAITSLSNQQAASFDTDTSTDRGQQPGAVPQSSGSSQSTTTLAASHISAIGTGLTLDPGPVTAPNANQVPAPVPTGANQPSQPAVVDQDFRPPHPRMAYPHEQSMPAASSNAKQPPPITTTQVPGYTHQTYRRSLSGERSHRTEDMQFYASDDPPSYDDRESFSPLMLPDLTTRRSNRYQPSTRPPPCSCTTGCPSHPGLTPPHYHRSPHNLTPPAPTHSPGQALPYPVTQPPLRPHQCRPDPQPMTYQPGSPKSSPLGPSQPPVMYQSLHPPPGPPHPSLMHACPAERPLQPSQHIDPRRAPVHRSPQQQPPGVSGAPYSDPVHGHSPALPPMDPQYLCGPQSLGPSYGSEYGGDTSSLYSESSYGQAPRRVLLDPETGKYFYIEVPVQPLRKMLYDPETGQYVEVLIPQQAMSHSGLYPPSAAPYPSLHNPNMYAPAPQYMPYAAPPPPAHPQTQPQPPRYPEPSAAAAPMHPSGPGVSYRNPSGQGSKPEPQNHPPLDQSYLESMYYVPTGMNASPNPTPPDYYHKHPPNLPPTGGKRS